MPPESVGITLEERNFEMMILGAYIDTWGNMCSTTGQLGKRKNEEIDLHCTV